MDCLIWLNEDMWMIVRCWIWCYMMLFMIDELWSHKVKSSSLLLLHWLCQYIIILSEGGCSLTCRIMTLAKRVVALLILSERGYSLSSRITTLAKRAWCSDGTTCILHLLSRCCCTVESCCCIVFALLSEVLLMNCCWSYVK
jgi:hypothetical protein